LLPKARPAKVSQDPDPEVGMFKARRKVLMEKRRERKRIEMAKRKSVSVVQHTYMYIQTYPYIHTYRYTFMYLHTCT
jgi:hypothetical protein